jgi:cytidylate kinase
VPPPAETPSRVATEPCLAPVLAIDGPAASGKGTIARLVASALGFHYLDSGAVYRVTALAALHRGLSLEDASALSRMASTMHLIFQPDGRVVMDGLEVTDAIRDEVVGQAASRVAVHPGVRAALMDLQKRSRSAPGLVAEGRDMGTIVFPGARLKVFLTASAQSRAQRRQRQLLERGQREDLAELLVEMQERDTRDQDRAVAPLRAAHDAWILDSSELDVQKVVQQVLDRWHHTAERPGATP